MEMDPKTKNETLLSQWKTCVDMANSVSQRRDTMNNLFVTLNTAIVAAVAFVWEIKSLLLLLAGIAVCILWLLFIRNYKKLNEAKFQIIDELERSLPYKPYTVEWDKLQAGKNKYIEGTKLENYLPIVFIVLYCCAGMVLFANNYNC